MCIRLRSIVVVLTAFTIMQLKIGGFAFVSSAGRLLKKSVIPSDGSVRLHERYKLPTDSRIRGKLDFRISSAVNIPPTTNLDSAEFVGISTEISSRNNIRDALAKGVGYLMGAGSIFLFSPIIFTLIKTRSADGFATSTWILNLMGMLLAVAYPVKMGFPPSTYIEVVSVIFQCVLILGLICFYKGIFQRFIFSVIPGAAVFIWFLQSRSTPKRIVQLVQAGSILLSTYANIPQIILTFKLKKASWSWITAGLSTSGCLVRMLTTLQLTKDKFAFFGYSIGFITNLILMLQVFYYN